MIIIITIIITNNWNSLIGDKINRQTDRHSNSFLDKINKKLESLEAIERSTTVERKNDRDKRMRDATSTTFLQQFYNKS